MERCTDTATLRQFQDRTPRVRFRPLSSFIFFPTGWKCQPEGEDIGSGCCGGGVIQLRLRERALLRQGQLSEPQASSGPAAMLLAISRNLSCIPRRSPCPGRYPLPLASVFLSTFRNQQYPPDGVLARTDILFLWRPPKSLPSSMHSPHTPHFTHHRKHPCTNNNHHNTNHTIQQSSLF